MQHPASDMHSHHMSKHARTHMHTQSHNHSCTQQLTWIHWAEQTPSNDCLKTLLLQMSLHVSSLQ